MPGSSPLAVACTSPEPTWRESASHRRDPDDRREPVPSGPTDLDTASPTPPIGCVRRRRATSADRIEPTPGGTGGPSVGPQQGAA